MLFLKAVPEESGEIFYYIIGSFSTVLTAVYDEAGNRYYADYHGLIRDTAKGLKPVYISYENLNKANGASLLSAPKALFLANEMKAMIGESL